MRLRIDRKATRQILRWTRSALLTGTTLSLGYCALVAADAWSFQRREHRQLEAQRIPQQSIYRDVESAPAVSHESPRVVAGDLIGNIEIPSLGLSTVVVEGVGASILRRAAGHIPGTALPGQTGNAAISGHRDTFFRPLRKIRKDDLIAVTTAQDELQYRVVSIKIVNPDDISVLASGADQVLTLVTCYPFYFVGAAPQRFVVRAERINF